MSRAFVKERDAESASAIDEAERRAAAKELLRIQKKKLAALTAPEAGRKIETELRDRWIADTMSEIERLEQELSRDVG